MKLILIVGTRPNFVKIASILKACEKYLQINKLLVHTGQHYSKSMNASFFADLEIKDPDINLEVGSGSHVQQTANIMKLFEPIVLDYKPDAILVVGDVNSTLACSLVAIKLKVKLIHIEAGLRSFDRNMPEEINRLLTDTISDILFVTEPAGVKNLRNEGIGESKIFLVGDVMADTLKFFKKKAIKSKILKKLKLKKKKYCVLTLHRPENVDDILILSQIMKALMKIQKKIKIIFPIHPRTKKNIKMMNLEIKMKQMSNLIVIPPLSYLDFVKLVSKSKVVFTDSGGIQEETSILGIPCLTLRENTERPITISLGTNRITGRDPDKIIKMYQETYIIDKKRIQSKFWDGKASQRIIQILLDLF